MKIKAGDLQKGNSKTGISLLRHCSDHQTYIIHSKSLWDFWYLLGLKRMCCSFTACCTLDDYSRKISAYIALPAKCAGQQ